MTWKNYEELHKKYPSIPCHILESLVFYRDEGRYLGQFGESVVSNRLFEAYANADDSLIAAMHEIIKMLVNDFPGECSGSYSHYTQWRGHRGLHFCLDL
jgi:hypothetical protein